MSRSRSRAGFTLIELLIAMAILGLIMLTLFGSLRFGARVWERTERRTATIGDIVRVQALLRREIGQAYPAYLAPVGARGHIDFKGDADSMGFLGPAPRSLSEAGRARLALRAESEPDGLALVLTARPELAAGGAEQAAQKEVLVSGLGSLKFSYFGQIDATAPAAWHESWEDAAHLPMLIRIEAAFAKGSTLAWPALTIAPAITADVSCRYDALIRDCEGR